MDRFEKLTQSLLDKHGDNSQQIARPDWSQTSSWTGFVSKDIRNAWDDIPYATQLLLYSIAVDAYKKGY